VWAACHVHAALAESLNIPGPSELTVGLRGTGGAILGGFAKGWLEPQQSIRGVTICHEQNVLVRREVMGHGGDSAREIAFSVGRQIENAFGSTGQRFRIWHDNTLGDFDKKRYSSR